MSFICSNSIDMAVSDKERIHLTFFPIFFACEAEKEVEIREELQRLADVRQLTTTVDIARAFEVRPEQFQFLVEKGRHTHLIGWHTMRGMWGTLLYPLSCPVVELLHRNWQNLRRENAALRAVVERLRKEEREKEVSRRA